MIPQWTNCLFWSGDGAAASNECRRYLNTTVLPRAIEPPVTYHARRDISAPEDAGALMRLVDLAARSGAEYFIVDDRLASPGEAKAAAEVRSAKAMAERIRLRQMGLGLTIALPDELSQDSVQQGCIDQIVQRAKTLGARWLGFRCDGAFAAAPASATGKGFYRVLAEVLRGLPDAIIECYVPELRNIDLGLLRRVHVLSVASEQADPVAARHLQLAGAARLPSQLNRQSMVLEPGAGLTTFADYDIACRMLGTMGWAGDLTLLDADDIDRLARMVEIFRSYRHLLLEDFYCLLPEPADQEQWDAAEFCAYDGHEAVVFAYSGQTGAAETPPAIRFQGLRANARYILRRLGGVSRSETTGEALMHEGLKVHLGARTFAAWHVEVAGSIERQRATETAARAAYAR